MTEDQKKDDEQTVLSFEEMFDAFDDGWTLSIYRETPKELSGFLEEIALEPGENPIDLQYLINNWGGKQLRLMLRDAKGVFRRRMLVQLKSFPPKLYGKIIGEQAPAPTVDAKKDLLDLIAVLKAIQPPPPAPQPNQLEIIVPLIAPFIRSMAEKMLMPQPSPPSQAASITEMMSALSTMRDFVQPAPEGGGDMGSAMVSLAEKVLPLLAEKRQAPNHHPAVGPMPRISPAAPSVVPTPETNPGPTDEQMMQFLQDKLANGGLGGEELTKLYFDTVQRLPDTERAKAERAFENALGLEPLEIDTTEDDTPPIPRGAEGSDEGND